MSDSTRNSDVLGGTRLRRGRIDVSRDNRSRVADYAHFRTRICRYKLEGKSCYRGENCQFAHSEEELRPRPKNTTLFRGHNGRPSGDFAQAGYKQQRVVICAFWKAGYCSKGDACKRSHAALPEDDTEGSTKVCTERYEADKDITTISPKEEDGPDVTECKSPAVEEASPKSTEQAEDVTQRASMIPAGGTLVDDPKPRRTTSSQTMETAEDSLSHHHVTSGSSTLSAGQQFCPSNGIPSRHDSGRMQQWQKMVNTSLGSSVCSVTSTSQPGSRFVPQRQRSIVKTGKVNRRQQYAPFFTGPSWPSKMQVGETEMFNGIPTVPAIPYIPNPVFLAPHSNQLLLVCQGVPCYGQVDVMLRAGLADGVPPFSQQTTIGLPHLSVHDSGVSYDV